MTRVLLYAIPAVVVLYALIDTLQTRRELVRTLPKWVWIVVVILVPLLGAIGWFVWGRPPRSAYGVIDPTSTSPQGRRPGFAGRRGGPSAPDDDPAFLRKLDDDAWSRRMRAKREGEPPGDIGPGAGDLDYPGRATHPDDSDTPDSASH